MKDPNEAARLLRLAMESARLTQVDVERRIRGASVSRYLSGERLPDLRRAIAIEDAYGVPVRAWFEKVSSARSIKAPSRADGQTTRQGDSR